MVDFLLAFVIALCAHHIWMGIIKEISTYDDISILGGFLIKLHRNKTKRRRQIRLIRKAERERTFNNRLREKRIYVRRLKNIC